MKVIKQGKLPGENPWRGDCRNCGSEIEAKQAELEIVHDQRDGSFGKALCPVCKREMFFYPEE